jgi:hypothetical protein
MGAQMTHAEEIAMQSRLAEDARRLAICDRIESLVAKVRGTHPDVPLVGLAKYLPEPQRSKLLALLEELPEIVPFPVEPKGISSQHGGDDESA